MSKEVLTKDNDNGMREIGSGVDVDFIFQAFASVDRAIIATDINGVIRLWNPAAERLYGWSDKEATGQNIMDLLAPIQSIEETKKIMQTLVEGGKYSGEYVCKTKSGGKILVSLTNSPIFNDEGELIGISGVSRDIREEKVARDKILASETKYRSVLEKSPDVVLVIDLDGAIVDCSQFAIEALEAGEKKRLIGVDYFRLMHPAYRKTARQKFQTVIDKGYANDIELEYEKYLGGSFFAEISLGLIRKEDGSPEYIISIGKDVTQRKKTLQSLKNSEARAKALLKAIPDMMFRMDKNGFFLDYSAGKNELYVADPDSILGSNIEDLLPHFIAEEAKQNIQIALKTGKMQKFDYTLDDGDNRRKRFEARVTPAAKDEVITIVRDVTEMKIAEEKLKDSLKTSDDIIDTIPSGIFIYRFEKPDKLYLIRYNPEALRITGINGASAIGKEFNEIWSYARERGITARFLNVMYTGIPYSTDELFYQDITVKGAYRIRVFKLQEDKMCVAFESVLDRIEAQKSLIESEKKFKDIFEGAYDGILYADRKGKVLDVNSRLLEMTGLRRDEIVGHNGFELARKRLKPGHVPKVFKLIKNTLFGQSADRFEIEYEDKFFLVSTRTDPSRLGITAILQDISEFKKSRVAIAESEKKFKDLFMGAENPITIYDLDGRILMVNDFSMKMEGVNPKSLIGKNIKDILPNNYEKTLSKIRECAKTGKTVYVEDKIEINDEARWFWSAMQPLRNSKGKTESVQVFSYDITDIKLAERERIITEERFNALFQSALDVAYLKDLDLRYTHINPTMEKTFNFDKKDIIGKTDFELFNREMAERITQTDKKALKGNSVREEFFYNFQGVKKIFDVIKTPMKDDENKVYGICCIARDVSDVKLYQEQLLEAKESAEESDRLKTSFLANVSHEIRTPLNAIVGFSKMLAEPDLEPAEKQNFFNIIKNSSNQLLSIINDVIDVSKIESGAIEIVNEEVDVKELFDYIESNYSHTVKNHGLNFKRNIGDECAAAAFLGDRTKIRQIIGNLIDNSLKFTDSGEIAYGCELKNEDIIFFVSDTGVGIPQEKINAIFERFFQINSRLRAKQKGVGLGLSICKALVEKMDGRIWIESKVKVGTTVRFALPYIPCEIKSKPALQFSPDENPDWSDKKILVAEDESSNFQLIRILLKETGITLDWAKNGVETLDALSDKDYDLILMDLKMPEMDGYETTKVLRRRKYQIPVIAQTAYAMSHDKEKALEAGCDDYIAKPILKEPLIDIISKHI